MRLLPFIFQHDPSLKGQLQRPSSPPRFHSTVTSSSPTPRVRLEEVTASQLFFVSFSNLSAAQGKQTRVSRCVVRGALSTPRFARSAPRDSSLAFRLCRCLVVDKNPVPHCLWSARVVTEQLPASTCENDCPLQCGTGFLDRQKRNVAPPSCESCLPRVF